MELLEQEDRWKEYDRLREKRQYLLSWYDAGIVGAKKIRYNLLNVVKKRLERVQERLNYIENLLQVTFTDPAILSYEAAQQRIKQGSQIEEVIDL